MYLNPDSHQDRFSDDAFGNLQRWFSTPTEIYISLCAIDGDETWSARKAKGAEDNINLIVARINLKVAKLREAGMIWGADVQKLQSALRALSPIAKMMKPAKGQKDMLIVSGQTHAVKAKAKVRVAQGEK